MCSEQEEILELFLLGKWLKTGTLSKNIYKYHLQYYSKLLYALGQLTVAVVLSSSEIFLVEENPLWPLPRHAKLPSLDNIPPQFTILQQRKINEVHYLVSFRQYACYIVRIVKI